MKGRAKHIINAVIIVALSILTVFYLSKTQIITPETIISIGWQNCIIVVAWVYLCFAFISLIEKGVYSAFCCYPYKTAFLTTVYGNLGSSLSPLKSAHFPLKAYSQNLNGLTLTQTLTGVTKCQIIFSTSSILVYGSLFVYLIFHGGYITVGNVSVAEYIVVGIGLTANVFIFLLLTLLSRNEKLRIAVLSLLATITKLFKRNLDKAEFIKKKAERLQLFKEQTSAVFSDFKLFVVPAVAYSIYMFMSCLAPYVSYLLVSGAPFSLKACFKFYILTLGTIYLINIVPIPGGCVASEFVFSIIFAGILGKMLGRVLLLWRFSTYYVPTVLNFIILIFTSHGKRAES